MKEQIYSFWRSSLIIDGLHPVFSKNNTMSIIRNCLVVALYSLLTALLTYPVAFRIGREIPGGGDAFQWMNALWYTHFAINNPDVTSLTHNTMIFYPDGIPSMPFYSAFNQVLTVILINFFQVHTIYSLLWLLSFILAAFGAFLLIRYLTNNDYAAFLSGLIFAFTPYHFLHGLGHVGATTIQWIPFCALYFMKIFREGGMKNCILAGIFYALVALSDFQYLVFVGLFIVLLFLYEHAICFHTHPGCRLGACTSILKKYLIIGIVAFSIILPLTISDIQVASSGNNFLKPAPGEAIKYSTDLLSFFLPSVLHPVFGGIVTPVYAGFTGNASEHTTYIGYAVLGLSLFALWVRREDPVVRFWAGIAVLFSVFSMGPVLHIAGRTVFTVFEVSVPLPHIILYYFVPFVENSRTTGRFFIVAALAFAVLAGYGCSELMKKHETKKILITLLLCALIIFEYLSIPFPVSPVDQPEFYTTIGKDPERYALLEIPITSDYHAGVKIIYYQTIHKKPVVGGQYARMPAEARDFEKNTPFINQLTYMLPQQKDIFDFNTSETGNAILSKYNIRYVILHTRYLTSDQITVLTSLLSPALGEPYDVKSDSLIVYRVKEEPIRLFLTLNDGWHSIENQSGTPVRWMNSSATMSIYSAENKNVLINLQAASFYRERTLELYSDNTPPGTQKIPTHFITVSEPFTLKEGENIVQLKSLEGCEIPGSIPHLNSKDTRCLSVAIKNIKII